MSERGWWRIEFKGVEPNESDLERISGLIKEGYVEGEIIQEHETEDNILSCEECGNPMYQLGDVLKCSICEKEITD